MTQTHTPEHSYNKLRQSVALWADPTVLDAFEQDIKAAFARAIRAAENAALERAAIEAAFDPAHYGRPTELPNKIRSLKSRAPKRTKKGNEK